MYILSQLLRQFEKSLSEILAGLVVFSKKKRKFPPDFELENSCSPMKTMFNYWFSVLSIIIEQFLRTKVV